MQTKIYNSCSKDIMRKEKMRINIFYNCSKAYIKYLYVSLYSLYISNRDYYIVVYIGTLDINYDDCRDIFELAEEFNNDIVLICYDKEEFIERVNSVEGVDSIKNCYTRFSYDALLVYCMFELLPDDINKIVRLHVDTIIKASLKELYFDDLEKYDVVAPYANYCFQYDYSYNNELSGKEGVVSEFFGAYNLKKINKNMLTLEYIVSGINDIPMGDFLSDDKRYQLCGCYDYLLTRAIDGKMGLCDGLKYNYYSMETRTRMWSEEERLRARRDSIIIHYDAYAPWNGCKDNMPLNSYWWELAKFSPYYDEFVHEYWKTRITNGIFMNSILSWKDNYKDKVWRKNRFLFLVLVIMIIGLGELIFQYDKRICLLGMTIGFFAMEPLMNQLRMKKNRDQMTKSIVSMASNEKSEGKEIGHVFINKL